MEKNIGTRALVMKNNLNFDIIGWLCIFTAGLGFIFPFSVIASLNLIFISLGITYLCYFIWREVQLQSDPAELKESRQSWLLTQKSVTIEEQKFEHKSRANDFILLDVSGITFNASSKTVIVPWSEVIQVRSYKVFNQNLHTVYTLKGKHNFDQAYKNHLELVELIKKTL